MKRAVFRASAVTGAAGLALVIALAVSACGKPQPVRSGGLPAAGSPATPPALSLEDALAELEALERRSDVNPHLFTDPKKELAQLLRHKAAGKTTFSISSGYTTIADLRFQQDSPEGDVYLTRGYANRGDYDQNGTVTIADITPLAQQLNNTWLPGAPIKKWDWKYSYYPYQYYSVVAVVEGNLNGVVDYKAPNPPDDPAGNPGDLPNFGRTVANYSIYGSDDPEDALP